MASLTYDILTDPVPLEVSSQDGVVLGAVHIVVSNPGKKVVRWYSIQIQVPFGGNAGDLTAVPSAVDTRIEQNTATWSTETPTAQWDQTTGILTVSAGSLAHFESGRSLVVVLDGFPVSDQPGVVLLKATEVGTGPTGQNPKPPVTLSLLKRVPRVPRNFRPEASLIEAGGKVTLLWDGPDTLNYEIQYPDGTLESVPQRGPSGWTWSPKANKAPKHAATYTLIATPPNAQHPPYHLTTSVQLSNPEYKSLTATVGVHTPWVQGTTNRGRIFFTAQGAAIRNASNTRGIVTADKAELRELVTDVAQVKNDLTVGGKADIAGELHAGGDTTVGGALTVSGRVDAHGELHTTQNAVVDGALRVGGRVDAGGDLRVAQNAAVVGALSVGGRVDAQGELHTAQNAVVDGALRVGGRVDAGGELHAAQNAVIGGSLGVGGRVDAQGELHTAQNAVVDGALSVGGRVDAGGELHVAQSAAVGGNLTVNGAVELNELLVIRKAAVGGDLSVNGRADVLGGFQSAGRAVIGDDLTVSGRVDAGGALHAAQDAVVGGALSVNGRVDAQGELHAAGNAALGGDLDVSGESTFAGRVNANGQLSVRSGDTWLMHVNDDQVAITPNLRVHGESLFTGRVNANRLLSVRNEDKWLMHVNDDQVSIAANLRVHGAFRSDS
ncbi:hypothetical protein ABT354_32525 [Streptomyces sp. NPDC000594]|uniref:hypothetical protein n=1 Tax=Streptomyces sp. NPDC000594 TaxID=3154261 RepID=UPI0033195D3D